MKTNLVEKYLIERPFDTMGLGTTPERHFDNTYNIGNELKLKDATIKFSGNEVSMLSGLVGLILARKDVLNMWDSRPAEQKQVYELWHKINRFIKKK